MRKLILLFAFGLLAGVMSAQTTVSATVTDHPDNQTWANGTWAMRYLSGVNTGATLFTGTLSSSGALSQSLPSNTVWGVTICPNASVAFCPSVNITVGAGPTQDASAAISAAAFSPRFLPIIGNFGYSDVEVSGIPVPGSQYCNVTSGLVRVWNGAWQNGNACIGGGSPGAVNSVFTRTGNVVAQTGDYTVSQVTGAAPLASPIFTGSITLPITGSTQCLHVNSSGVISGTGADCGSGGSTAFSAITAGTNTNALVIGSGGSLGYTGTGTLSANRLNRYVYLSSYANGSPAATCNTNTWPHAGCVDETTQIQAAIDATTSLHATLVCDSPIAGNTYFASHLIRRAGSAGIVGVGFQYNQGGCTFSQIPGSNQDFMVSDPTLTSTNYCDEQTYENFAVQGDATFTSTSGSGFVFNCIVGERTQLNKITVGPFPNHGIAMNVGSDPVEWIDIAAGGNGYASSTSATGSGVYINGPYGRVDIYGLSLDDNKNCGVYVAEGLTYTNASQIILRAIKGENRSDNSYQPGQNYAVCLNGMNNTPVIIDGISMKSINPASAVSTVSVVRASNVVTVTWPPNFLGFGYLTEPRVGSNIQLAGLTPSDLNQICTVTATSGQANPAINQTITCSQTGSNETASVQGTVQWNSTANAVVQMTSGSAALTIKNWSVMGGANSIGPMGYANLINDNGTLTAIGQGGFGNTGNEAQNTYYFDGGATCTDTVCQGSLGTEFLASYEQPGDTYPRQAFTGNSFVMGTGSATPDLVASRGADLSGNPVLVLSQNGSSGGTAGLLAHSLYTDGFQDLQFGTSPFTGSWAIGFSDGALKPGNCGTCHVGEVGGPVGSIITNLVNETVGSPIAAAATIAPVDGLTHITGTAAPITTITPPYTGFTGCIHLWPDAAWSLATGGNISVGITATTNQIMNVCYDGTHWTPSGGASGGGSTITCSTTGGLVYYNGTSYVCDTTALTDGSGNIQVSSVTTTGSTAGAITGNEIACSGISGSSGKDLLCADSTAHRLVENPNNGGNLNVTLTVASGSISVATGAISSAACATTTTAVTGVATTDRLIWQTSGSLNAVTGYVPATTGGLTLNAYLTSGNVVIDNCNWTSGSVTPGAVTVNYMVLR